MAVIYAPSLNLTEVTNNNIIHIQRMPLALFCADSSPRNIHYDLDKRLVICTYLLINPQKYYIHLSYFTIALLSESFIRLKNHQF